jgi:hypothetical protein
VSTGRTVSTGDAPVSGRERDRPPLPLRVLGQAVSFMIARPGLLAAAAPRNAPLLGSKRRALGRAHQA